MRRPCGQSAHVDCSVFVGTWWVEDTTRMLIGDVVGVAFAGVRRRCFGFAGRVFHKEGR